MDVKKWSVKNQPEPSILYILDIKMFKDFLCEKDRIKDREEKTYYERKRTR